MNFGQTKIKPLLHMFDVICFRDGGLVFEFKSFQIYPLKFFP